ncbi:hypothetical protein OE88DRAFT_1658910 [Heliocybe sulcata]|uniref:Uncharacterized protein n=1 Tax=Heliocybe sulcata TaxID=5364 RepID=A0A5C3N7T5_9AGAM|nr:hypothetical protein OE88DRAFT_1658910 [Heliocybe sulcata]
MATPCDTLLKAASLRTTVGCLTGSESHVRYYSVLGSHDSMEVIVYPHDRDSGPFTRDRDSGCVVAFITVASPCRTLTTSVYYPSPSGLV